jgi:FKBP-type peptidyl-prolyl cis-trans isomerase
MVPMIHRSLSLAVVVLALSSFPLAAQSSAEKGDAYLKKNATKEGVKTTPSGLQYEVLTEGSGKTPKATDVVEVNYRGTLIDGTEFDSSYKRGESISFSLNGVIPGWTEGLQLMQEGAKYRFSIPSNLAYGKQGAGGTIGPDETLVFDVELIKVK